MGQGDRKHTCIFPRADKQLSKKKKLSSTNLAYMFVTNCIHVRAHVIELIEYHMIIM